MPLYLSKYKPRYRSTLVNTIFAVFIMSIFIFVFMPAQGYARWEPKQNTSPFDLYDHDKHYLRYAEFDIDCEFCHRTDDSYNREKVYKLGCHKCHNNERSPSKKAARYKCITCHKDLTKVKPDNHSLNWQALHQTQAKQNKNTCYKCHKKYYCTDCHQKRDFNNKRMHSRLFRYFHSIEARSNPSNCVSCHKTNFCTDCHSSNSNQ
jgi:hypothetical protein